jgi:hypothetical protein
MIRSQRAPALLLPLVAACGMTFGVDAVETTSEVSEPAAGVSMIAVEDLGVEDSVEACGDDGDELRAEIDALAWTAKNASSDSQISASFERAEGRAVLTIGGDDETLSLKSVRLTAPANLATQLHLREGDVRVCDFAADIDISADSAALESIEGVAVVDAEATTLLTDRPVELDATGSVEAQLRGGSITAAGDVLAHLVASEEGLGALSIESQATVQLVIDSGQSYTIELQSAYAAVSAGDIDYASDQEGAESPLDGLIFDIRGGGETLRVVGASVAIGEI